MLLLISQICALLCAAPVTGATLPGVRVPVHDTIKVQLGKWGKMVKDAGIQPD